jgi:hypothetical protein
METVCFSETFVSLYQTTRCQIPENSNLQPSCTLLLRHTQSFLFARQHVRQMDSRGQLHLAALHPGKQAPVPIPWAPVPVWSLWRTQKYCDVLPVNTSNNLWVADFFFISIYWIWHHQAELQSLKTFPIYITWTSNFFWFFICPKLAQTTPEDLP